MIYPLWQKKKGMNNYLLNEDSGLPKDFVKLSTQTASVPQIKQPHFQKTVHLLLDIALNLFFRF